MAWINKLAVVILFVSLTGIIFSIKTAKAIEAKAPEGSQETNKIEYKSEGLRNPFEEEKIEIQEQPQVETQAKPLPSLQIQGTVWGGGFPQAIINNKVVKVGDTIEGTMVADINKSGVVLFFENWPYTLSVSSPVSSQGLNKENPSLPVSSKGLKQGLNMKNP